MLIEFLGLFKESRFKKVFVSILLLSILVYKYEYLSKLLILYPLATVLIVLLATSLIVSDKKSNEKYEERKLEFESPLFLETNIESGVLFTCFEEREGRFLIVKMENLSKEDIFNVKGTIKIFSDKVNGLREKIAEYDFTQKCLERKTSIRIKEFDSRTIRKLYGWTSFEVKLKRMTITNNDVIDLSFFSYKVVRTYYFLFNFNKYVDKKIFFIETPFNLVWIKERISDFKSYLMFQMKSQVFFLGARELSKDEKRELVKDHIRKWFCRLLFVTVGFSITIITGVSFWQLALLFLHILNDIGKFVVQSIK